MSAPTNRIATISLRLKLAWYALIGRRVRFVSRYRVTEDAVYISTTVPKAEIARSRNELIRFFDEKIAALAERADDENPTVKSEMHERKDFVTDAEIGARIRFCAPQIEIRHNGYTSGLISWLQGNGLPVKSLSPQSVRDASESQ